jgi:hypothetical protein
MVWDQRKFKADECLTDAMKLALMILLDDGRLVLGAYPKCWAGASGRQVRLQSATALYDRGLVRLIVESRHRKTHILRLTPLGEYAAEGVKLKWTNNNTHRSAPHGVSEKAARFIVEVTS